MPSCMRILPSFAALALTAAGALSTQAALAQETTSDTPPAALNPSTTHTTDFHLAGEMGIYTSPAGGGISHGVLAMWRGGPLEVGIEGQFGLGFFSYSYFSAGAVGGLVLAPTDHWRFDLLGQVGGNQYVGFDNGSILSHDPGASAALPYAGLRASITHRVRTFEIGIAGGYVADIGRTDVHYTYNDTDWFSGRPEYYDRTVHVGTDRVTAMLTLGGAFDL